MTFAYQVAAYDVSTWAQRGGIGVTGHRLDLNGGSIRSVATQADAHLWYAGLAHDLNHKVRKGI